MTLRVIGRTCVLLGLVVTIALPSVAQVRAWERWYDSPNGGDDEGAAVAMDAAGNVYVTGYATGRRTYRDYCTIKYAPDGRELWVRTYDGPASWNDQAYAIAVDRQGNVYVTGESYGKTTYRDYATIKYDPSGNVLWVRRYDGPAGQEDAARAIALDHEGNVYVTGGSERAPVRMDYATIKYSTEGEELWVRRYAGVSQTNQARAIAVDAQGNCYVTGESYGRTTMIDYATIKYDTDGRELWADRYSGPTGGTARASAIVLDGTGGVIVTGVAKYSSGVLAYGFATIKYDEDGSRIWVRTYGQAPNDLLTVARMAADSLGNVYVVGALYGTYNWVIIKYDPSGDLLWARSSAGTALAVAVDPTDHVYVAGEVGSEYTVIRYGPGGEEVWTRTYDGPGDGADIPRAIAVDALGKVVVTGLSQGGTSRADIATVAYNAAGDELWVRRFDGDGGELDRAYAVTTDGQGNVYVTGYSFARAWATAKYDADGNELWVRRVAGVAGAATSAHAVAADAYGNVLVAGQIDDNITVVKYDEDGDTVWTQTHSRGQARAIVTDSVGNVYVTGSANPTGTNSDTFTVKYDAAGNVLWSRTYDGPAAGYDAAEAICLDRHGSVYITGISDGGGTKYDYVTIKYDAGGGQLWIRRYNGPGNYDDGGVAIAVDTTGDVYVTGRSSGAATSYDYATVKYDSVGNEMWVRRYDGPVSGTDTATGVALDALGNVYVTGTSSRGGGLTDFATLKYASHGEELWVRRYRGPEGRGAAANALAVDAQGNVHVAGTSGPGSLCSAMVVRYDRRGNEVWADPVGTVLGEFSDITVDASGRAIATGTAHDDYVTVCYESEPRRLSGRVVMEWFVGDPRMWPVTFEIREPGTTNVLETRVVPLDESGAYSFETLATGRVDVAAKGDRWLREVRTLDLDAASGLELRMIAGDANGDNRVDLLDLHEVLLNLTRAGPREPGDVDGNSQVDLADLQLVLRYYGRVGAM